MSLEPSRCLKVPHWDSRSIPAKSALHSHELFVACFTSCRTWCSQVSFHFSLTPLCSKKLTWFFPLHTFRSSARSLLTVFRHLEHLAHGTSCLWHIRVQLVILGLSNKSSQHFYWVMVSIPDIGSYSCPGQVLMFSLRRIISHTSPKLVIFFHFPGPIIVYNVPTT